MIHSQYIIIDELFATIPDARSRLVVYVGRWNPTANVLRQTTKVKDRQFLSLRRTHTFYAMVIENLIVIPANCLIVEVLTVKCIIVNHRGLDLVPSIE